jgi:hypothetical protein
MDEQLALIARLKAALGRANEREAAEEVLRSLQDRHDLYQTSAREIETLLPPVNLPPPTAPPAEDWPGHDVVDADGQKIGELEAVYVDTGTDLPFFATVKVGMVGRHRLAFVPLDGATVAPEYVKVSYTKRQVKDAPSIDTDGVLLAEDEESVFKHYGLVYQPGAGGERRLGRR